MIILVSVDYRAETPGTLRWATAPYRHPTAPAPYAGRIAAGGVSAFRREIFADGQSFGVGAANAGTVRIAVADGRLDWIADVAVDGSPVEIAMVKDEDTPWPDRVILATMTASRITVGDDYAELSFNDALVTLLDKPVQADTFRGDNEDGDGLQGGEDLMDVWVPVLEGVVRGIDPVWVNAAKYIGVVADRNMVGGAEVIVEVLDGGGSVTRGNSYPTMAALEAATTVAGEYDWCPGGPDERVAIRLGSQPGATVICKVALGLPADRTVAQIYKRVLTERAGETAADFVAADLTDLDAACPGSVGAWTGRNEMSMRAFLDTIVSSAGAGAWRDYLGRNRIRQITVPGGEPVARFVAADSVSRPRSAREGNIISLTPLFASRDDGGLPFHGVTVRFGRMYVTSDKKSVVEQAFERVEELCSEWREASASNDAVQARHPQSVDKSWDSAFDERPDAEAEAARRLVVYSTRMARFGLTVPVSPLSAAVDLNDVVLVEHPRHGLRGGKLFRVSAIEADLLAGTITLTIWRVGA